MAIIGLKLKIQMAYQMEKRLYHIFLDLTKAYDTLNQEHTMEILCKYGVGPNIAHFIQLIWEQATLVLKQAGNYRRPFQAKCSNHQGNILLPTIFNTVTDA